MKLQSVLSPACYLDTYYTFLSLKCCLVNAVLSLQQSHCAKDCVQCCCKVWQQQLKIMHNLLSYNMRPTQLVSES